MAGQYLSEQQLSAFCGSLGMMLRSGISVQEAVSLFTQGEVSPADEGDGGAAAVSPLPRAAAQAMEQALAQGDTFSEAARQSGVFPEYALGVFRSAELSGRLEEALGRLAEYYERQERLYDRLRSTITYPVALLLMMCCVLAVLVFGVLPMFLRVYGSLTGSIAASAYAYVPVASAVGWISLILAALFSLALLTLALTIRTPRGREKLRRPMERSPFTRRAARLMAVSRMADTVSMLLSSGADEGSAMDFALEQTTHEGLRTALEECRREMAQGTALAQALLRRQVLPPLYGRLLLSGEESGLLPQAMETVSRRLGQQAEEGLSAMIDRMEPVLIGFLTLSVGFTLLSVMLPLLGILNGV